MSKNLVAKSLAILQPGSAGASLDAFSAAFARAFPDEPADVDAPSYVDEFTVDLETGTIESWACASNDLLAATGLAEKEKLGRCPAPQGDCPRGMVRSFQCKEKP